MNPYDLTKLGAIPPYVWAYHRCRIVKRQPGCRSTKFCLAVEKHPRQRPISTWLVEFASRTDSMATTRNISTDNDLV
jgi:hypothetical protein